ncbi:beta-galactosidase trimerization domain-containing protein [Sphingomonas naphthae]|uniref:Beta-galactosidase trimerization domain-containing protein n=1 Tax=Sphingomonas naphthae TaxID=1813468 RepID=A0ABY7TLM6_9SPHN|nr:alpha-amylase family protein [Sphingomonas naphthae]WCT74137.1 beta-galactosidase trimerization domain-containing protein [Sphingomonas naphthae]
MPAVTRRTMLGGMGLGALAGAGDMAWAFAGKAGSRTEAGWEKQPMRWFQLAFTEDDIGHYDPQFWLDYFREIHADGVCLSAGGGIAFYPTKVAGHGKARGLGDSDPFGEMARACKAMGLRVLARVDSHAMPAEVFAAHPEWAACASDGTPRRHWTAKDLYLTCPYTGYNFDLMVKVIREIVTDYPVDALFGNRVNTLGVCYCNGCRTLYRAATGADIPIDTDPVRPEAQRYWAWSESRIMAMIDLWDRTLARARPNSFFVPGTERRGIVDYDGKALGERLPMVFCDRQARSIDRGLFSTGEQVWGSGRFAKELRAYAFDKPISSIISVGVEEEYRWKDSVQAAPEIRIWAASAIAQGSHPWITKFNAKPFDKSWMPVVASLYQWHHKNERYLRNTANLARIGMVLDLRSPALQGGLKHRRELEEYRLGFYEALLEARVPFDEIDRSCLDADHLRRFRVLVLPNVAMLSDRECQQIREYVLGGGRIVATHTTSLYDETGRMRADFGLADLFGCRFAGTIQERVQNSYLTLRHPSPILAGLEAMPRVIGAAKRVEVVPAGTSYPAPLTLVPSYPDLPMERVFSDTPTTDIPMAYCRDVGKGRVVYLPMDIDRTFAELRHGGHLAILKAMVAWAADETAPMTVEGPGLVDMAYWRQAQSLAAHIVNYNNPMAMAGAYREAIRSGPYTVSLELPLGAEPKGVRLLESDAMPEWRREVGRVIVTVPSILYHEVVAVDLA